MRSNEGVQQQFYEMLLQSQYWSPLQLQEYQRRELGQLLRHARTNVPFYENRLETVFRSDGSFDWGRWYDLPIVTRSDLLQHREAMQAKRMPAGHRVAGQISTSGSTGAPITITVTDLAIMASNCTRWRWDRCNKIDWSARLYVRSDAPKAKWPHGGEGDGWGPPWDAAARGGPIFVLDRSADTGQQLDFVRRTRPDYIAAGAKPAHTLALEAERYGVSLPLRGVFVSGEAVSEDDRQAFSRVFGAPTYELYSSKEGNHMAYRCGSSGLWHVNAELLLLEVLDEAGRPCRPGESGRVVITPFFSTAQPLIRYEHGDVAEAGPETCPCGCRLPLLKKIAGRVTHMFRHPDGRRIARSFPDRYRSVLGCTSWQVAQVGPLQFELRYVPIDWGRSGDEASVAAAFRDWYFADAELRFRRVREIAPSPGGKIIETVYEVAEGGTVPAGDAR